MDKREARFYIRSNVQDRRPSFLGGLFSRSRSSSVSEDSGMMAMGMQRRGSIDPPDLTSVAQKLQQQQQAKTPAINPNEMINIFT